MKVVHSLSWSLIALVSYCYNCDCGSARGGGGTTLYYSPKGYGFLSRCGLKTGVDFAHFGLESAGMVFKGTMGVDERIYRFNSIRRRKKENYANSKWILKNLVKLLLF